MSDGAENGENETCIATGVTAVFGSGTWFQGSRGRVRHGAFTRQATRHVASIGA